MTSFNILQLFTESNIKALQRAEEKGILDIVDDHEALSAVEKLIVEFLDLEQVYPVTRTYQVVDGNDTVH